MAALRGFAPARLTDRANRQRSTARRFTLIIYSSVGNSLFFGLRSPVQAYEPTYDLTNWMKGAAEDGRRARIRRSDSGTSGMTNADGRTGTS
jgi:hypothetical protein